MKKRESIMKKTIGVLGLGLFGTSVARTLSKNNVDVIAMDKNIDHLEELVDEITLGVQGDFTRLDQLAEAGFGECDEVIVAASQKLEDSILAILNLQKLDVPKITVKTKNEAYQEVLLKVGATRVILPEVEMGYQVGMMLANPSVHELIKLDSHYNVIEFLAKEAWVGKSVASIDFRRDFDLNIIAVQHEHENDYTIEFGPNTIIQKGELFIGVTTDEGMQKLI